MGFFYGVYIPEFPDQLPVSLRDNFVGFSLGLG